MNGPTQPDNAALSAKIARLVRERGWNQEDFARITNLNRQTIRQILSGNGGRRLRNATVGACARALGLSVHELLNLPVERLLARMMAQRPVAGDEKLRRLYELATQPELVAWMDRNPERARQLSSEEIEEILSLQGSGGPLTRIGVERFIETLERKRRLIHQIHAVAGTEYLELLEKLVALLYEKVQPERDRT
jgi:transcriptional regulator with XRE-family HTH domain